MKNLFKPTTSPNHHLPHEHHIANDSPPQQENLIRTKSQMINICSDTLEGLSNFKDENSNDLDLQK